MPFLRGLVLLGRNVVYAGTVGRDSKVDLKDLQTKGKMSYEDYLSFTREWLAKCYKVMKDDGRFCLNIPLDKSKGGQQSVCADIRTIAK